jgi:hypothetical protein
MFNIYQKEEEKLYKIEENIEKYNENSLTHIKSIEHIKKIKKIEKEEIIKICVNIILNTIVFRIIIF